MAYFSTNNSPIYWKDGSSSTPLPDHEITSWPVYFVWDEDHELFFRSLIQNDPIIYKVGPIPISHSSDNASHDLPGNSIAVFDSNIFSSAFLASLGVIHPYYPVDQMEKFLSAV